MLMEMSRIFLTICVFISSVSSRDQERKVYIAYMGSLPKGDYSPTLHHMEIIKQVVHPSFSNQALVRSYKRSINGFAAYLSEEEKEKLTRTDGIVSVFPSQKLRLQTTNSWNFMGLSRRVERHTAVESDTIIGVIDSGIWPESESFNDEGFGPIPAKWKGACDGGTDFVCNRKIIGARTFTVESWDLSARDTSGHGTHCASVISGNEVTGANYYGFAKGIARGGVPSARLAVYKVCAPNCDGIDILSAFDHAIADGVDIISTSLVVEDLDELMNDPIAIGAFHAMERGILTVNSAGNDGPNLYSIKSHAPWILTVGASDTNRKIVDKLLLGTGEVLLGHAINPFPSSDGLVPLVYGKAWTSNCSETEARNCLPRCLESSFVKNKVILCDPNPFLNLKAVKTSGVVGCIVASPINDDFSEIMPFPVIALSKNSHKLLLSYINHDKEPKVQILRSETIENTGAPFIASFSSRGPSIFMSDIIKPDVIAPGVEILAAFSPIGSPSGIDQWGEKSASFSIMSGTSMACPHVVAAAAFIKSFHPDWSPSAIKSALMTTAWELSSSLHPEAEFAYGSGHIFPKNAKSPGLVYETSAQDYLKIWCNTSRTLGSAILTNASCPTAFMSKEINYPSMAVQLDSTKAFTVLFTRTVTNVGQANSTYVAFIEGDHSHVEINVEPRILQFTTLNKKLKFVVTIKGKRAKPLRISLIWKDGVHRVRSPIVAFTKRTSSAEKALNSPKFHMTFIILMLMIIVY